MSDYQLWEVSGKLAGLAHSFNDPAKARKAIAASKVPAALIHDGVVHSWSPAITAAQKAVIAATLATGGAPEHAPPGPDLGQPVPPRTRVVLPRSGSVAPAEEDLAPAHTPHVMTQPTTTCPACGEASAPWRSELAPELRDLCSKDRLRAQKRRNNYGETPAAARAWLLALTAALAKGEPPPGRALMGGKGKAHPVVVSVKRRAAVPLIPPDAITYPVAVLEQLPAAPAPTPAPTDVLARVAALIVRAGSLAEFEHIVDPVEQLRRVA